jgi:hypothetical protein
MTDEERFSREREVSPPPPKNFDPLTADPKDLAKYGLPQRPDPQSQPELSALWERQARRYRTFEHLPAEVHRTSRRDSVMAPEALRLHPVGTCGYVLDSSGDTFTSLSATWTVPNLRHTPSPLGFNHFRTFMSLGFLDVHVEMTVDSTHNVTSTLMVLGANGFEAAGLPVQPGDVISATICLIPKPPGEAHYLLANVTRSQTVNFRFNSGFRPASTISVGISRDNGGNPSLNPLAHFGIVYFDEILVLTSGAGVSLTDGEAVTMVDLDGTTLATPFQMSSSAFKIVRDD